MSLQLPEKPEGFTRRLVMHLNFGSAGGAATYSVHDRDGNPMPFGYQYDTRKEGLTGFTVPGVSSVMTWAQLREHFAKATEGTTQDAAAGIPEVQWERKKPDDSEGGLA